MDKSEEGHLTESQLSSSLPDLTNNFTVVNRPRHRLGSQRDTSAFDRRGHESLLPDDDDFGFFASGREYASHSTSHKYTAMERKKLCEFESLEYLPSHSLVYKDWLKSNSHHNTKLLWLIMGLIGFIVGLLGFLLHQIIAILSDIKWQNTRKALEKDNLLIGWAWVFGMSSGLTILGSSLVVFLRPQAASSGIPELIGFLNGSVVRHIFNVKTLIIKFLSCSFSVSSGLPVGPEGPMIHMGSLVGAGISQFKSDTLKIRLPCSILEPFRNFEDRRNFISAGAAAGVASAFGAPVGGLLFSMEEVSSFWNMKLSCQTFFCAMIASFTTALFDSAFNSFKYKGDFGTFQPSEYILFNVTKTIPIHVFVFLPAIILGIIGGLLGPLFTFCNLKIVKLRQRILAKLKKQWAKKSFQIGEPLLIMMVFATVTIFLPYLFECRVLRCTLDNIVDDDSSNCQEINQTVSSMCRVNGSYSNSSYNPVATLMFGTGEDKIYLLFSRHTYNLFQPYEILTVLPIYFILACWTSGTYIASGLLVPMLFIGGCYGRLLGHWSMQLFGKNTVWLDPGSMALIGAASFFSGTSRLTMSLAVIMIELTNDVPNLLPIMTTIMVSKWVGDYFTHPHYLALLELKCIPHLDDEASVKVMGRSINLEMHSAKDVMATNPVIIRRVETVAHLANMLLSNCHHGFPVIQRDANNEYVFFGLINRYQLIVILKNRLMFSNSLREARRVCNTAYIDYQSMTLDKLANPDEIHEMLLDYVENEVYKQRYVNIDVDDLVRRFQSCIDAVMSWMSNNRLCLNPGLPDYMMGRLQSMLKSAARLVLKMPPRSSTSEAMEPYVNQSAISVVEKFSLQRCYILFRTLGLRHMTVVNNQHFVVGMITRKDLMAFNIEAKITNLMLTQSAASSASDNAERVPLLHDVDSLNP